MERTKIMNREEYMVAMDTLFTGYEREEIHKYGLEHILDKIIYQHGDLIEKNYHLEKQLDTVKTDLNNASMAQINLLPTKIDFTSKLDFAARFIPSQYVSGDTYNVFRLDEDHVGLYQIDISGHGVAAALFSVSLSQMLNANISNKNLLKTVLKNKPYYMINSPSRVLSLLNDEKFFERYQIFFTMIYMIINIRTGDLQFSRAGHNPPIILRADGCIQQSKEGGLPIGWDFDRVDPVINYQLEKGDRIFLYSDGICEARNHDKTWFGDERLNSVIKKNISNSLDETLNDTIRELSQFTGSIKFEDDISILGLTYLG
ncbi:MAG: serine/threonine-protein phosphatase [Calditrichaeota bacterium]|nr:MAG: serine/threonine-protein phosphatase [Calditrichota bacterium]MBL1206195.1 serine/threonine-protein phosphatase [Calditrichota bacterium]NOG46019.1 serine/threonine-protein phosphatase [Calditrichota bacterium]